MATTETATPATPGNLLAEWARIGHRSPAGLAYWITRYVQVYDPAAAGLRPMSPWPGQVQILRDLADGLWLWILKARRLGISTIVLAYCAWRLVTRAHQRIVIMSQTETTATDLLAMWCDLYDALPEWQRIDADYRSASEIAWNKTANSIVTVPATRKAARSLTGDVIVCDEAAFCDYLGEALRASQPILETTGGTAIVLSTSNGPANAFAAGYWDARNGRSRYKAVFLDCWQKPGRNPQWRDAERIRNRASIPNYVEQEYPENDVECFESAGGAVFTAFSRSRHVVHRERPPWAKLYRGMDWGASMKHPFVCVWLWHDDAAMPGFSIEPACEIIERATGEGGTHADGIAQLAAYRRDPDNGKIRKDEDDLADAIRYAVTHFQMHGHVHVYRILFVRSPTINIYHVFRRINELSGMVCIRENEWSPSIRQETYAGTVGDRSGRIWMNELARYASESGVQFAVQPYQAPKQMGPEQVVEQGVAWLQALMLGDEPAQIGEFVDRREKRKRALADGKAKPPKSLADAYDDAMLMDEWHADQRAKGVLYGYGKRR